MRLTVLAAFVVSICCADVLLAAPTSSCSSANWQKFKETFQKQYETATEEIDRRRIFCSNLQMILDHNERYERGEVTFEMGVNQFADWTSAEFRNWLRGTNHIQKDD